MDFSGKLYCGEKDVGIAATEKLVAIETADLPSLIGENGVSCNQSQVFYYSQLKDKNGIVRSTDKTEILGQDTP